MLQILSVCTGNICRSPLAEQLLRTRLADVGVVVSSAGTRAPEARPMTPEARHLAVNLGVPASDSDAHRSRFLTEAHLAEPDLIITMTREQRRTVAELAPARFRSTFTLREFARLASDVSNDDLRTAVDESDEPSERLRSALAALAGRRGIALPPQDPADDDVIDPYRQSWEIYQQSAAQMLPALGAVETLIRTAATV